MSNILESMSTADLRQLASAPEGKPVDLFIIEAAEHELWYREQTAYGMTDLFEDETPEKEEEEKEEGALSMLQEMLAPA